MVGSQSWHFIVGLLLRPHQPLAAASQPLSRIRVMNKGLRWKPCNSERLLGRALGDQSESIKGVLEQYGRAREEHKRAMKEDWRAEIEHEKAKNEHGESILPQ